MRPSPRPRRHCRRSRRSGLRQAPFDARDRRALDRHARGLQPRLVPPDQSRSRQFRYPDARRPRTFHGCGGNSVGARLAGEHRRRRPHRARGYKATLWSCTVETKGVHSLEHQDRCATRQRCTTGDHHHFFSSVQMQSINGTVALVESVCWHSWQKLDRKHLTVYTVYASVDRFRRRSSGARSTEPQLCYALALGRFTYHYPTFDDFTFVPDIECYDCCLNKWIQRIAHGSAG